MAKWHPTHIFEDIIPVLQKAGVTNEQINKLLVENPRRFFEA
jgi:phosphotriesterase-related protein